MASTADRNTRARALNNKVVETHTITTAQTVYIGTLVNFVATTGRVTPAVRNIASRRFAGIVESIVNDSGSVLSAATGNTAGTVKCQISYGHEVLLNVKTAARTFTSVGMNVFVSDNDTVTDTTDAGTSTSNRRIKIGALVQMEASDKSTAWVSLRKLANLDAV